MISPLVAIITNEFFALASLALTVGISGGILFQAFSRPETVVLFSTASAILFGALGGGFRRQERVLEFLLTRNIQRAKYYFLRFSIGLVILLPIVILTSLNLVLPMSGWFWSLFVESGLTYSERMASGEGFGWMLLSFSTAIWTYSIAYYLVSRARDAGQVFIALLAAIVVTLALPVMSIGISEILAVLGFLSKIQIYSPLSFVWITYHAMVLVAAGLILNFGIRWFKRVDVA